MSMKSNEINALLSRSSILITGAMGFVGRNLLGYFMENGIKVNIVCKPNSYYWRWEANDNVRIFYSDFSDLDETLKLFNTIKPEFIFHLASGGGHPASLHHFQVLNNENCKMTSNLLEASLRFGIKRFIFCGSSLEGEINTGKIYETYNFKPHTWRGIVKAQESMICNFYAETLNLFVINLRIFHAYGPWEQPTRFVPTIIMKFLNKQPVTLVDPDYRKDYIFVGDIIQAFLHLSYLKDIQSGTILNMGSGLSHSTYEIFTFLKELFGYEIPIDSFDYAVKDADKYCYTADLQNLNNLFAGSRQTSIIEGLERTVSWIKNHQRFYV